MTRLGLQGSANDPGTLLAVAPPNFVMACDHCSLTAFAKIIVQIDDLVRSN